MSRYVEVPADAIRARLAEAGFKRITQGGREEVYERRHDRNPLYAVKVYSSIASDAAAARGCGEDAIRVVAVRYQSMNHKPWEAKAIMGSIKVLRTAPEKMAPEERIKHVLDRMVERAREAYGNCNDRIKSINNHAHTQGRRA